MNDYHSGPLIVGRITFQPRPIRITDFRDFGVDQSLGSFPYSQLCPVSKEKIDADQLNREYDTTRIVVNKHTHRIRFEDESEGGVVIVIEPK